MRLTSIKKLLGLPLFTPNNIINRVFGKMGSSLDLLYHLENLTY